MLTALLVLLLTATGAAAVVLLRRPRPGGARRAEPPRRRTSHTVLGVLSALAFVAVASQVTLELGRPSQASQERAVTGRGTPTGSAGGVSRAPVDHASDPGSDVPLFPRTTSTRPVGTSVPATTTTAAAAPSVAVTAPTTAPATATSSATGPTAPRTAPTPRGPERTKKPHPNRPSRTPR